MEAKTTQKVIQTVLRKMIDFWIEIKAQKAAKGVPGEGKHYAACLHARPLYLVGVVKTESQLFLVFFWVLRFHHTCHVLWACMQACGVTK